jgi:beta-ureidopropionase / N-carbamoyl-L-amino-acid hydrolase
MINIKRLCARIDELAQIGRVEGTQGVCRLAFTEADQQARDYIITQMKGLGLRVAVDRIGNVFGTRPGQADLPAVMTGSHIDSVRTGGRLDGALGVLAGLEVVEALNENAIMTRRPLTVAVFSNEEGARFQPDMMGSLVFQGDLDLQAALDTVGIDGISVRESLARIGMTGAADTRDMAVYGFVELHIEQGPVLETLGRTIGIVEGVQGISWTQFVVEGTSNHAGTTPMNMRTDAGHVATRIATFARALAGELGPAQLATVGALTLYPNLVNVVPSRATITVDLRNTDDASLSEAEARLSEFAGKAAAQEGASLRQTRLARFAPVSFARHIMEKVEQSAAKRHLSTLRMPSGAGHDAQILARMCPSGMIFVPSVGGLSHNVNEFTNERDLDAGAMVLFDVLYDLAMSPFGTPVRCHSAPA